MNPLAPLKLIGGPGSLGLLVALVALAIAVGVRWPRARPAVAAGLVLVGLSYLLLAIPDVAHRIADALPANRIAVADGPADLDLLIVLDGDNRRGRLAAALRVWRTAAPSRIVVSGERWLVERLREAGVPAARLEREIDSRTTFEQMQYVRKVMIRLVDARVAVVASRLQMPRVEGLAAGSPLPVLIASSADAEPPRTGMRRLIPSYAALRLSRDALYEHAALAHYEWRGLISPAPPVRTMTGDYP